MNVDLAQMINWGIQALISFVFGGLGGFIAYKISQRGEYQRKITETDEEIPQELGLPLPKIRDVIERTSGILDVETFREPPLKTTGTNVRGYLVVEKSPNITQAYFSILDKNMEIGRDEQCDISLDDVSVSRLHAMIFVRNDAIEIVDQSSTNGTYVNGKKIATITLLNEDDNIQIGNSIFQYKTSLVNPIETD